MPYNLEGAKGAYCRVFAMYIYLFLYIYLFVGMFEFTVQSVIVYGVHLFSMPGIQCVVYTIEYKVVESPCYNQSLFTT